MPRTSTIFQPTARINYLNLEKALKYTANYLKRPAS